MTPEATFVRATSREFVLAPEATAASSTRQLDQIPLVMPHAQMYYWSFPWQSGERETLAGLEAGEYVDFASEDPEDAARWLRESESDS